MIDDRTTNYSLPLPNAANALGDDVGRLRAALTTIDTTLQTTNALISTSIANLIDSAPSTLDTLHELANAIGDDPNFSVTVSTHIGRTDNPHAVTKTQVGLSNVANSLQLATANNLSDLVSASTARSNLGLGSAATLAAGAANGVATLDGTGNVPLAQLANVAITWQIKSANYTAVSGDHLFVDTSGGGKTITLPASPAANASIGIADYAGTFGSSALIIARNGSLIMGLSEDMTVAVTNSAFALVYSGASKGWRIV